MKAELLAIGSSTGGTAALSAMLRRVTAQTPPVVVVQHMTKELLPNYVQQLRTTQHVRAELVDAAVSLCCGKVFFATGNRHLLVKRAPKGLIAVASDAPPECFHRPSIDLLLHSVASAVGRNAVGVLLSGMGADGASGLAALHELGATTAAQDEASSGVFGIAAAAGKLGAVDRFLSPAALADLVGSLSAAGGTR